MLEKKKEKYFLKDYLYWVLSLVDWGSYMIAVLILKKKKVKRLCETVSQRRAPRLVEGLWPLEGPLPLGEGQGSMIRGVGACWSARVVYFSSMRIPKLPENCDEAPGLMLDAGQSSRHSCNH